MRRPTSLPQGSAASGVAEGGGGPSGPFSGDRGRSPRRKGLDGLEPPVRSGWVTGHRGGAQRSPVKCPGTLPAGEARGRGGKAPARRGARIGALPELQRDTKLHSAHRSVAAFGGSSGLCVKDLNHPEATANLRSLRLVGSHGNIEVDRSGVVPLLDSPQFSPFSRRNHHSGRPLRGVVYRSKPWRCGNITLSGCVESRNSVGDLLKRGLHKFLECDHEWTSVVAGFGQGGQV